jgi:hypothetical protein
MPNNPYTREELIAYIEKAFEPGEKIFVVDWFDKSTLEEQYNNWAAWTRNAVKLTDEQFESICELVVEDQWLFEQLNTTVESIVKDVIAESEGDN